jgi:glucose/arabinose dehydrogenase
VKLARLALLLPVVLLAGLLNGCAPTLGVSVVRAGLTIPWDLTFVPNGTMYFTERPGRIWVRHSDGEVARVSAGLGDLFANGETGLMGIVADPGFNSNRRIYTCQGATDGTSTDIRVVPWVVQPGGRAFIRQTALVTGLPVSTGRHGGCRLRFGQDGRLWIGTGDAAIGTNPQSLTSLGGKILRVDKLTGAGVAGNPFAGSTNANTRRIWSWGHRNVQGLALRPDGTMWNVQHGSDRDDEVNSGAPGNYGWDPVPGYNETVPMTDTQKFPNAIEAEWSSGFPTIATSGATWLTGSKWEDWNGALAVATLKGESLRIMRFDANGNFQSTQTVLAGTWGRLRTAQLGPDGNLYLTTSNGSDDKILRVTPS